MSRILTPTLQRAQNFRINKIRELTLPGKLNVKVGDKVKSHDIVASAEFPGELIILRIAEQLGIEAQDVLEALLIKEGDKVESGQIICEYRGLFGLFKNVYNAPNSGEIEFINKETGHIGLRLPSYNISLDAYISGTVVSIEESKSVTIQSECTYVQGIFGVGGEKQGELKALNVANDHVITENDIPDNIRGSVLFGGLCPDSKALNKAMLAGAVGFITASIDDSALADFLGYDIGIALTGNEKIDMTLIVTEGFGRLAFSQKAHDFLKSCEGFECSINGATQVRAGALRPEIIIENKAESADKVSSPDSTDQFLKIGSSIRIIREPYFGIKAKVSEMPANPEIIESGAYVRVLRAELENGRLITVPRANVEIF